MKFLLPFILLFLSLTGCEYKSVSVPVQPTGSEISPIAKNLTQTPRPTRTSTTVAATIPIKTLNAEATLRAFEGLCEESKFDSYRSSMFAPNAEWVAIMCESDKNVSIIVHNQEDVSWVLHFADFLYPDLGEFERSGLWPLVWSGDGRFLYFTKHLSYSGGGNQCFPSFGSYGLFRLDLAAGTLVTLVPPDDNRFPGDRIRFSPTTEYYAVDINGVTITNLVNGDVTSLDASGVMDMNWSPDGRYLAFSIAKCGEQLVESSSIFVWDSSTKQIQLLFSSEDMVLRPRSWINSSQLEFEGETWVGRDNVYTIFEYDIENDEMIFSATATPRP